MLFVPSGLVAGGCLLTPLRAAPVRLERLVGCVRFAFRCCLLSPVCVNVDCDGNITKRLWYEYNKRLCQAVNSRSYCCTQQLPQPACPATLDNIYNAVSTPHFAFKHIFVPRRVTLALKLNRRLLSNTLAARLRVPQRRASPTRRQAHLATDRSRPLRRRGHPGAALLQARGACGRASRG